MSGLQAARESLGHARQTRQAADSPFEAAQVSATIALAEQVQALNLILYSTQVTAKSHDVPLSERLVLLNQIGPRILGALDLITKE